MRLANLSCAALLTFCCSSFEARAQFSAVSNLVGYGSHVVQASDGNFYVDAQTIRLNPTNQAPGIYRVTPSGDASLVVSLPSTIGTQVLIQGIDGALYGISGQADQFEAENTVPIVLYKVTLDGKFTTVLTVPANTPGATGPTSMVQDSAGDFYITTSGGDHGDPPPALVKLSMKTLAVTVLHQFENETPLGSMFLGSDGALYGAAGAGYDQTESAIFRVANNQYTEIYSTNSQYAILESAIVEGPNGFLYGFESSGDAPYLFKIRLDGTNAAQVGEVDPPATYISPSSNLLIGSDGNIYGITGGSLFATSPETAETTVFGQVPCINDTGGCELGNLTQGSDSAFYFPVNGADTSIGVYRYGQSAGVAPALLPPVQIVLSPAAVTPGQQSTLTWKVTEPYSDTAKLCVASGSWSGVVASSGTMKITPASKGEYTYGLNCGETEGNAATLIVGAARASTDTSFSLTSATTAGAPATLKASVKPASGSGTPTGTVALSIDGQAFLTLALVSGAIQQQISTAILPAGPSEITATYSGDVNYLPSSSAPESLSLQGGTPPVTTTSTPAPAHPGQTVELTIKVNAVNGGKTPTGYLTINGTKITLVDGVAQYSTTAGPANEDEFQQLPFTYSGDTYYTGYSDYLGFQEIVKPLLAMIISPSTVVQGQSVTVDLGINDYSFIPPTGTLTYYVDSKLFSTVQLTGSGSDLTVSTAGVPPGAYSVTAVYSGDANFTSAVSNTVQVTITAP